VLEDWARMLVDAVDEDGVDFGSDGPLLKSWVSARGPIDGILSIIASPAFVKQLARNLLGNSEEQDPSEEECHDAFREMGNVLAGNFFTEAYGESVVFEIITPTVEQVAIGELNEIGEQQVKFYFIADDLPLVVSYRLEERQCQ